MRRRLLTSTAAGSVIVAMTATVAGAYWAVAGQGSGTATTTTLGPAVIKSSTNVSSTSVPLAWDPAPFSQSGVKYYAERTGGTVATSCGSIAAPIDLTSCTDTVPGTGTYTYTVKAVYRSWTSSSAPVNVNVNVASRPTASVALQNRSGGSVGRVEAGDKLVITYSAVMDASKFCPAWANDGIKTLDGNNIVNVTITDNGANDVLAVSATGCTPGGFKLGTVALNGDYVSATASFNGNGSNVSILEWNPQLRTLSVTLGKHQSGTLSGATAPTAVPSYTPDPALADLAGNLISAGPLAGTSSRF